MKSKVANGKFNIFLGKVFNEKIERFLDNLFEYIPFTQATKENVRFYKEILKITPSFVSLLTARNGVVYVYTAFGYFIVKLYHNIYGEQIAIILDVVFSHPYNLIYGASSKPSNLSPSTSPLSFTSTPNKKYRVIGNAGYGFQIVKGKDGTFNYINSDGRLLYPRQWFKEVKPFKKTKQGILAFVNNNGICNAIDSNGTIYDMNRAWKDCFTEGKIKKDIMTEAINKISQAKHTIRLTESELKGIITESVRQVVRTINEKKEDHSYKPIGPQTFYTNNGKIERKSIVTLQSPSGQVCHIAEDDHCYVLYNGSGIHYDGDGLKDKNCEMIHYIFPEAFKALKELPLL